MPHELLLGRDPCALGQSGRCMYSGQLLIGGSVSTAVLFSSVYTIKYNIPDVFIAETKMKH